MGFTATTPNSAGAWRPDIYEFAPVDVVPEALILQASTVANAIEGDAPSARVAYVADDGAGFTAEGNEIPEAHPVLSERLVHTAKVTQLVRVTREQYMQGGTANQLAQSVARAIVRRANIAFVAEPAPTPPAVAPAAGIFNTTGVLDGGLIATNLDELVDLVALLQDNLAEPSHILLDPLGWAAFRRFKVGGSNTNESLLGAGTTDATPMLLGLPVIVDPALPDNAGLVVDKRAIVSAVGPIQVATSDQQYFSSDEYLLRATWRFGHAVVRPSRIGKFTVGITYS